MKKIPQLLLAMAALATFVPNLKAATTATKFKVTEETHNRLTILFELDNPGFFVGDYAGGSTTPPVRFDLFVHNGDAIWAPGFELQGGIFGLTTANTEPLYGPALILKDMGSGRYDMVFTWKPTSAPAAYGGTIDAPTFHRADGVATSSTVLPISGTTTTSDNLLFADWSTSGVDAYGVAFEIAATNLRHGTNGGFSGYSGSVTYSLTAIPEPSTYGLAGAGTLALLSAIRRRRQQA